MSTGRKENRTEQEKELCYRLRQDDRMALEQILRFFGDKVHLALARRFDSVLSEADLEDAMAVALFRLWATRQRYDPERASLRAWFYLLARNAAIEIIRRRSRQPEVSLDESLRSSLAWQYPHYSEDEIEMPRPEREAMKHDVEEALKKLPERERWVLLKYLEHDGRSGWTATVTEKIGVTANYARVLRLRALNHLRQQMLAKGYTLKPRRKVV